MTLTLIHREVWDVLGKEQGRVGKGRGVKESGQGWPGSGQNPVA